VRTTLDTGTPVEVARPADGRDAGRGLVLIPDIMGLRPLFDAHAQRIADEQGWAVAAVEPWPGREDLALGDRMGLVGSVEQPRLLGDAMAAADLLGVDPVGITGFCMGGMFALLAIATGRFDRAVAFYGMIRIPEQWRADGQQEPIDAARADGACPALAIIGTADQWTPADDVADLEAAGVEVARYEGADHGFVHDPDRPAHRADDAADAWRRALAFLSGSGG
jgi:carboxymethylenebutenolidase